MADSNARAPLLGVGLATLLALLLRVIQLDFQPLWWDEGYSVFFATRDFPTLLARTAVDIHPPLYYALLQAWTLLFGTAPVALRLLSVLISVAAVPLSYLVAAKLYDARTGIAAAFLMALAPLQVYYAQEVRMYGLVNLFGLASVALQLRLLTATDDSPLFGRVSLAYVAVTAAGLYTQYFFAFIITAQLAVVFYLHLRRAAGSRGILRGWILRWLLVAALYLPWLVYAGPKLYAYVTAKVGIEQYTRLDPLTYLVQHLTTFSTGHLTDWTWVAWGALGFVLLAAFGIVAPRSADSQHLSRAESDSSLSEHRTALVSLYLFVPLALGFLVNLVYTFHPIRYERLLLFAAPFFLILVAAGLVALLTRARVAGVLAACGIVVLCALALYDFYTVARYPDEDYRPLIQAMQDNARADDLVYAVYPWQVGYLRAYYRGAPLDVFEVPSDDWAKDPSAMGSVLAALHDQAPRAWLLAYQTQGRIIEARLANEYSNDYVAFDQTFGNTRLEYFARESAPALPQPPLTVAPDLALPVQSAAFDRSAQPPLALWHATINAGSDAYAYSLRVVDAGGSKLVQQDEPIPMGTTTFRRALNLPRDLPPGEYALQLVLYRRADGQPVTLPNGATSIDLANLSFAR